MLRRPDLFKNGFHLTHFELEPTVKRWVEEGAWAEIDAHFQHLTAPGGKLFEFLLREHDFKNIEFILSIRDAQNDWEEDGIWHDDGSRMFSFSLSLTLNADEVKGGCLRVKKKEWKSYSEIPTPRYGDIILFLTGAYGFEHKIHQVTQGTRVVIAGWCT